MGTQRGLLAFEHLIIDSAPLGFQNDVCLIGDINGNGRNDVVIGGKYGQDNLAWYENPTWARHIMATTHLEAGGVLFDVNGNGRLDVIAGNPMDTREGQTNTQLLWFECPQDPRQPWTTHLITDRFKKYHDQAIGDVDGDGEPELLFASQGAQVVAYYDIPPDPAVSPWPEAYLHIVSENLHVEGLAVADVDGDGENEIVAGPNILKRNAAGVWARTELVSALDPRTCVAVGDLTGNGLPDIVLSEGELDSARVLWLRAPSWEAKLLGEGFFHPHSLKLADFDGNGKLDIFVAEMGLKGYASPREVIFRNLGGGAFDMEVIGNLPTHGATVGDISGNGKPDIVGKPFDSGRDQVDLWLNRS